MLFSAALVWGAAFSAQKAAMVHVGPYTFQAVRSILGGIVLLPVIFFMRKKRGNNTQSAEYVEYKNYKRKDLLIGGLLCGIVLAAAANLQQLGIIYTTPGKAGFITALYIVIVPLLGIPLGKKAGKLIWAAVALALIGLYLLSMADSLIPSIGDIYVLLCALVFSFHILVIDAYSHKTDCVELSCVQFFVCGIVCAVCMFIFETPDIYGILKAWAPILYAGIMSCGVAYTFQVIGQKYLDPTVASLVLSLESVFSALCGLAAGVLGILPLSEQLLSTREVFGCCIVFTAVIIAQLQPKNIKNDKTININTPNVK